MTVPQQAPTSFKTKLPLGPAFLFEYEHGLNGNWEIWNEGSWESGSLGILGMRELWEAGKLGIRETGNQGIRDFGGGV